MPAAFAPDPEQIPYGLWAQLRRHSLRYGVGFVLLAAYQAAQYFFDTRLMLAIDAGMAGDQALATHLGLLLLGIAVGSFGVRVLSRVTIFNGGRLAEYELRRALLHRLQQLGPSFYRRMSAGEIMSRATNDLTHVRLLLGFAVLNVINTIFALTSALAVALTISVELTLASLAILPPLALVTGRFAHSMFQLTRDNQAALGRMSERVQASLAGVRVVRSFGLEAHERREFEKTNQDYLGKSLALARLRGAMGPIMQSIGTLGVLIVFLYGGHLMLEDKLAPGGFLAFYRALARLTWPLIALGFLVSLVQRGRAAYARLVEIFESEPEISDGPAPAPDRIEGRLEVRGLSFAYGANEVLEDVSFTLPVGGSLAVLGRTGSGKSTLAALLPRLQPTPHGSVYLDGQDVCELPLEVVRRSIGYSPQTAFVFSTTVGRNIGYVLDEPDEPEALLTVREAAERARVLDEVLALPDGFDTVVGERGVQLSGGQRQRVALARALVAEPKVLVLDDPLSAVDARAERAILDALEQRAHRGGVLLITHRVSAAARMDSILVLDRGRVVERGTHEELVAAGGLYATFASEQQLESELEALEAAELVPAEALP
jgi:ATP-binding cassette subfamily B protein